MTEIVIKNGPTQAVLGLKGAFLQQLISNGKDIIFPTQFIGEKIRGGIPVCAPVFGPAESVGLSQHGFARDIDWEIVAQTENEIKLTPVNNQSQMKDLPEAYQACEMELVIRLNEDSLMLELMIANTGAEPYVCSPGFHPYFPTEDAELITINSQRFTKEELLNTQFLSNQEKVMFSTSDFQIRISNNNLNHFAIWSANPDRYICVEPTFGGYLEHQDELFYLGSGQSQVFEMIVEWEDKDER